MTVPDLDPVMIVSRMDVVEPVVGLFRMLFSDSVLLGSVQHSDVTEYVKFLLRGLNSIRSWCLSSLNNCGWLITRRNPHI